jgi:hypothetical protein
MSPSVNKLPSEVVVRESAPRLVAPRAARALAPATRSAQPSAAATFQSPAPARAPKTTAPAPAAATGTNRWVRLGFTAACLLVVAGFFLPTARYISPRNGVGYILGIIGGSLMLLLLLYPARKRLPWLGFIGSIRAWFGAHMALGIIGPLLILYHSNFSLGATNSNAALIAMLLVSGSGVIGRYFYTRIYDGLNDRRQNRNELQTAAKELREKVSGTAFVPNLLAQLDAAEERLLACGRGPHSVLVKPIHVSALMVVERWKLTHSASRELASAATNSRIIAQQRRKFSSTVKRYIAKRLNTARDVAEFESYEKLFSLWHWLHVPLFFILLVAGIVHVFAVHMY